MNVTYFIFNDIRYVRSNFLQIKELFWIMLIIIQWHNSVLCSLNVME